MSLSPMKADGFRTLFFHPLSSNREFAVSTGVLRNQARATAEESYHDYQVCMSDNRTQTMGPNIKLNL